MLPSSIAPSSPRVALLNRAPAGASSLMSPSTMIQRPKPSLARPLKLATVCCSTASSLLTTGLVVILLSATDAHQHDNLLSKTKTFGMILKKSQGLWVLLVFNRYRIRIVCLFLSTSLNDTLKIEQRRSKILKTDNTWIHRNHEQQLLFG
nr:uncharacterized protein LOC112762485 isoform X2 [Arachis hypogaea]